MTLLTSATTLPAINLSGSSAQLPIMLPQEPYLMGQSQPQAQLVFG